MVIAAKRDVRMAIRIKDFIARSVAREMLLGGRSLAGNEAEEGRLHGRKPTQSRADPLVRGWPPGQPFRGSSKTSEPAGFITYWWPAGLCRQPGLAAPQGVHTAMSRFSANGHSLSTQRIS